MTPAGLLFEATPANSGYLSRNDHRSFSTDRRNKWATSCAPPVEYSVFCRAELAKWRDSRPQLWGLLPQLEVIGLDNRKLAKFPNPKNATDAWHGYPISALDPKREFEHRPEPALVNRWLADGLITPQQAARIKRGKV